MKILYSYCDPEAIQALNWSVIILSPTLKKLMGHIAFGLSVRPSFHVSRFFMPPVTFELCMLGS